VYRIGEQEVAAFRKVIKAGKPFRYGAAGFCDEFERRYGKYLGVKHVTETSSGTSALVAGLMGLGIGPGDEVIVPAHTYMASAASVLAVGAIPVIVDIAESLMLDPEAAEDAVGPRTRAIIPCHMWGLVCDMDAIMRVARKKKLLVLEDACQAIGGAYKGKKVGSIGKVGAFSFNFYKHITCGEGGAVVTNDAKVAERIHCAVDCCGFFWNEDRSDFRGFVTNSSRASEFEGAILTAQLGRLPGMIKALRQQKKRIIRETSDVLQHIPYRDVNGDCGSTVAFQFKTAEEAKTFAEKSGGNLVSRTGRHNFFDWAPILHHEGGHHPAMNPYKMAANRKCRRNYPAGMCRRTVDIVNRTVKFGNHPDRKASEVKALIERMRNAAK